MRRRRIRSATGSSEVIQMRIVSAFAVAVATTAVTARSASAQNVTVQQPVFGNFSVSTTVSVPDRGGAFIGGVKRAGSSRKSFGPIRSGSSIGLFRDYSGVSTHVTIHDFDEMDRMLLEQARSGSSTAGGTMLTGNAAHAWESLAGRKAVASYRLTVDRRNPAEVSPTDNVQPSTAASSSNAPDISAERSFQLGLKAELRGRRGLALLHYRLAARLGSTAAREKLSALGDARLAAELAERR